MSVQGSLEIILKVNERLDSGENRSGPIQHDISGKFRFGDGTSDNQIDIFWSDRRELAGGANEILDLAGILADSFGNTITAVEVVGFVFRIVTINGSIDVGPDATAGWLGPFNAATDRIECGYLYGAPGLVCAKNTGWTVGAGGTDELYVENNDGANSVTYDVGLMMRSA